VRLGVSTAPQLRRAGNRALQRAAIRRGCQDARAFANGAGSRSLANAHVTRISLVGMVINRRNTTPAGVRSPAAALALVVLIIRAGHTARRARGRSGASLHGTQSAIVLLAPHPRSHASLDSRIVVSGCAAEPSTPRFCRRSSL